MLFEKFENKTPSKITRYTVQLLSHIAQPFYCAVGLSFQYEWPHIWHDTISGDAFTQPPDVM